MAIFFPNLGAAVARMQSGERRFARRAEALLEDDYLCWYDVGIGGKNLHPDFTLLHPGRGLLILEVKDWKKDSILGGNRDRFEILTPTGPKTVPSPLEQARQYAQVMVDLLARDPQLREQQGLHRGKLAFPWGYGVVFSNLSRKQVETMELDSVIPGRLLLCKDDLAPSLDAEEFQTRLWQMFSYQFGGKLSQPQIDRIRWHLWPEVRVGGDQLGLLEEDDPPLNDNQLSVAVPDMVRVMDYQQEQLARSLGEGHRVIHGVAGSGKTMILGYRCLHLARLSHKPILVLCFNVTLAAKLRSYVRCQRIDDQVQVYHFHEWCGRQLQSYQAPVQAGLAPLFERRVEAVIQGVEKGLIPRAQYGAVMIDEAHDFNPDWLQLVTGMVDPETNSLLLLYDDAQSIYRRNSLGFSLSSVGVQARGRTTILKLNYRNTRQILQFAYQFASNYLEEHAVDEDHLPLIRPEAGGGDGDLPVVREFHSTATENSFIVRCIQKWYGDGCALRDIAVIYRSNSIGSRLARALDQAGIAYLLAQDKASKASYDPAQEKVSLLTMHSSKGLEFSRVIVAGVGEHPCDEEALETEVRLLYIAMTRAMDNLLVTSCRSGRLAGKLHTVASSLAG